jgi:hypothetical protein
MLLFVCALGNTSCNTSCIGTTGGDLFTFSAAAAGPLEAGPSHSLEFTTGLGYRVTLTRANVHIGAVYLNRSLPLPGAQETSCIQPGMYIAEVTRGLDVDALSPTRQPFPGEGEALAYHALAAEVWLTGGDVNAEDDETIILDVEGSAQKDGVSYPFEGKVTIGKNRAVPVNDPARPGANPICKQRIVSVYPVDIAPRASGRLLVRVDPRGFFTNVDFSLLDKVSDGPPLYRFADAMVGQPNVNLFQGLTARQGSYEFEWEDQSK